MVLSLPSLFWVLPCGQSFQQLSPAFWEPPSHGPGQGCSAIPCYPLQTWQTRSTCWLTRWIDMQINPREVLAKRPRCGTHPRVVLCFQHFPPNLWLRFRSWRSSQWTSIQVKNKYLSISIDLASNPNLCNFVIPLLAVKRKRAVGGVGVAVGSLCLERVNGSRYQHYVRLPWRSQRISQQFHPLGGSVSPVVPVLRKLLESVVPPVWGWLCSWTKRHWNLSRVSNSGYPLYAWAEQRSGARNTSGFMYIIPLVPPRQVGINGVPDSKTHLALLAFTYEFCQP